MQPQTRILSLCLSLLIALMTFLPTPHPAEASRMREVGGYGIVLRDTPTFAYGSLDSAVNGTATAGEVVFINGWQIGVYYVGVNRWIAASAVRPIIDANGTPMGAGVTVQGGMYYLNGQSLALPPRHVPMADQFLANPTIDAPIVFQGSSVPEDMVTDIVDTSQVRYSPGEAVVATMRVTDLYSYIYLRTAPDHEAPLAGFNAYRGEILTAYEVVDGNWYRIGDNVWAPARYDNEVLMVPENVASYAPPEYRTGGKWISVDLDRQRLTAWEGDDVVVSSPVKSGKYGYATPTGVYQIYEKIPNERMSGNDYDLKDVSYTQYFTGNKVAIHAAYWHNNYNGRPGSHGCVNVPPAIAEKLFMWSPTGTTVVTHNAYQYDQQDIQDAQKWNQFERY
jgi:hypothetical protein